MEYPTKKEILEKKITLKKESLLTLKNWKKKYLKEWNKKKEDQKLYELEILIKEMNKTNNGKKIKIILEEEYAYYPQTKTITQNKYKPSIISSLHELAHHLYGDSELIACTWSIKHFMTIFPKQFKKLKWKGHLLVKQ